MIQAEQTPIKESKIKIDPNFIDENGLPRVVLDWKYFEQDLQIIKKFVIRADHALQKAGLASLKINDNLYNNKQSFMESLHDTYHQSGGALMGKSDQDGVVNRNLKVFGTKNLYIAGSSTFRTGSGANSVFTALAFATRLVEHLSNNNDSSTRIGGTVSSTIFSMMQGVQILRVHDVNEIKQSIKIFKELIK